MTQTPPTAPNGPDTPWHADAPARARAAHARAHSPLSGAILAAYRLRALRPTLRRLAERLEGGPLTSETLRAILRRNHDVEVGRYSYGPVLTPGVLPPGSHVGRYCSVASALVVRRRDHPIARPYLHPYFYNAELGLVARDTIQTNAENPLKIGHDVWIGDRVTILSGCRRIGNGAVLAAGAVVTVDVEPYAIIGGVPGREIRRRFDDATIAALEESRWWEREIDALIEAPDVLDPFTDRPKPAK